MSEADSYRKTLPKIRRVRGNYGGDIQWKVESSLNPVSFRRLKDAKAFHELLTTSVQHMASDIVRVEKDEDGYILT